MKIRDLINLVEGREVTRAGKEYFSNPTSDTARGLLRRSLAIRGLVCGSEIIIWNSGQGTHAEMGNAVFGARPYLSFAVEKDGSNKITSNWDNVEPDYWYDDYRVYGVASIMPLLHRWFPPST